MYDKMNMDRDEEQLKVLLDEIRKQGSPYASTEPDQLYWANFRVRVMDQIEAKRSRSLAYRVKEWFSPVRAGIIGLAGAAAIAFALVTTEPARQVEPQVALKERTQAPATTNSESPAERVVPHESEPSVVSPKPSTGTNEAPQVTPAEVSSPSELATLTEQPAPEPNAPQPVESVTPAESIDADAAMAVLNASEKLPESLDELSQSELEALLDGLNQDYN
jgi:hypothetical protein